VPELRRRPAASLYLPFMRLLQQTAGHPQEREKGQTTGRGKEIMRIVLDAMGGDHAPGVTVQGQLMRRDSMGMRSS